MGSITSKTYEAAKWCGNAVCDGGKMVRDLIMQVGTGVLSVVTSPVKFVCSTVDVGGKLAVGLVTGGVGLTCRAVGKLANLPRQNAMGRWFQEKGGNLTDIAIQKGEESYEALKENGAVQAVVGVAKVALAGVGAVGSFVGTPVVAIFEGVVLGSVAAVGLAGAAVVGVGAIVVGAAESGFAAGKKIFGGSESVKNGNKNAHLHEQKQAQVNELKDIVKKLIDKNIELEKKIAELRREKDEGNGS